MSVSIIIPTFKRPDFLERLLKSIQVQSYRDFEVIVIDDHSPNVAEYESLVDKYARFFPLTFISNPENRGAPYSRNVGIMKAKYELLALVDDDDEWLPLKLEKQVEAFQQGSQKLGLVYTWTDVVEPDGGRKPFYHPMINGCAKKEILHECFIPSPSVMVKKEAILKAGLFDESFLSCQDWDTWTRIIFSGHEVKVIAEALTLYHKHGAPTIGTSPRAKQGFIQYYRKHFCKLFFYGEWRHLLRFFRLRHKLGQAI